MKVSDRYIKALGEMLQLDLQNVAPRDLGTYAVTISDMAARLNRDDARESFVGTSYLDQPTILDAYTLYYSTSNLPKIFHPLNELETSGFFSRDGLRVLDLGSGTGAMLLGLSEWLSATGVTANFTAVDRSASALERARVLIRGMTDVPLETIVSDITSFKSRDSFYDLIVAGNAVNELSDTDLPTMVETIEDNLAPSGFFIAIEPALKSTSRRLLAFRDLMLEKKWHVYAPCFTQRPCPALAQPDDWCHHTVHWQRPTFMEILDEMIGHVKKSLKFTYLILSRNNVHLGDYIFDRRDFATQARVVSDVFKEKGRRRAFLCNDCGRLEFLKNNRDDSDSNEAFDKLRRYDVVEIKRYDVKKNTGRIAAATMVRPSDRPVARGTGVD